MKTGMRRCCNCTITGDFRAFFMEIISNKAFEYFILFSIVANCIFMAVEPSNFTKE